MNSGEFWGKFRGQGNSGIPGKEFRGQNSGDSIPDREFRGQGKQGQENRDSIYFSNMLDQARELSALFPRLDRDYLERRIREETCGDHGIEDIDGE